MIAIENITRAMVISQVASVVASAMSENSSREDTLTKINQTFSRALQDAEAMAGAELTVDRVERTLKTVEATFELAWPVEVTQ